MAETNSIWRKTSIVFTIIMTLIGSSIVYGQLLSQSNQNKIGIKENSDKIERFSEKVEQKLDKLSDAQKKVEIQNAEILSLVKYLKGKAND